MKKTALKKLALNKETLRSLHETQLPEVAGEAPGGTSLQYSRCETCGIIPCSNTCVPSNCG
ncbi:MAG TPA: class I lanthipeptide [Thermoanaerobaculia bacterium]|nr:class I lanthipeptide [Thermoanaerobaculia bacterium]